MSHEKLDRNREIHAKHKQGASYLELANEYSLSVPRIKQIIQQVYHDERIVTQNIREIEEACDVFDAPLWMNGRIQNSLKDYKLHILNRWRRLSREEILKLPGIGDVAADILQYAQKL